MRHHSRGLLAAVTSLALAAGLAAIVAPAASAANEFDLQLVSINDFHGRITDKLGSSADNWTSIEMAAQVETLMNTNPNSLFVSVGDNIGASTFVSASLDDNPTIDILNAMGLAVSAVGNHEFDKGMDVLKARDGAYPAVTNPDYSKADFSYLGANVYAKGTTNPVMKEYEVVTVNGVRVGFVGLAPEDTPTLVVADMIKDFDFGDPVEAANREADYLIDNNLADVLVLLAHMDVSSPTNPLVTGASSKYAAILSGHSHATYNYQAQVPGAAAGVTRPVIQSASYGTKVGQVVLHIDGDTKQVLSSTSQNISPDTTKTAAQWAADPAHPKTADAYQVALDAKNASDVIGNEIIGQTASALTRTNFAPTQPSPARSVSQTRLGLVVAQGMLEATADTSFPAQLAITNPGGIRADIAPAGNVTYSQAATVLPFANNLQVVTLKGSDIKEILEQQWQTELGGTTYDKFLAIAGMTYSYDATRPYQDRVFASSMMIDGVPMDMDATYQVATNNFLAGGGDNFTSFTNRSALNDTGKIDTETLVEYFKNHSPVPAPDASWLIASIATGIPAPTAVTAVTQATNTSTCPAYTSSGATIEIPTTAHVVYQIDGTTVSGTVTIAATDLPVHVTVTAVPESGYAFEGTPATSWDFDLAVAPACPPIVAPNPAPVTAVTQATNTSVCPAYASSGATIEIPTSEHAAYQIDGATVSGTLAYAAADLPTRVTITAVPETGYAFDPAATTSWDIELAVAPACDAIAMDQPLFRFYKADGTHFYTASADEAATVKTYPEYKYEGIAGYIGSTSGTKGAGQSDLYRFYKSDGTHFYTASAYEASQVKTYPQYTYEGVTGVVWETQVANTVPVERFYKFGAGTHFYTASAYEAGLAKGYPDYRHENTAFFMKSAE